MHWHDIQSAPRDGRLILLHDPNLERWITSLPPQRIASRDFICVGRWADTVGGAAKQGWVSDQRTIVSAAGPEWLHVQPQPKHWCELPAPPPGGEWLAVDNLPPSSCYVLLFDPALARLRELPMAQQDNARASMVVGSWAARVRGRDPAWVSDYVEEDDLVGEAGEFYATPVTLSPTYWIDLPPAPAD
jgi:hypothetical protein